MEGWRGEAITVLTVLARLDSQLATVKTKGIIDGPKLRCGDPKQRPSGFLAVFCSHLLAGHCLLPQVVCSVYEPATGVGVPERDTVGQPSNGRAGPGSWFAGCSTENPERRQRPLKSHKHSIDRSPVNETAGEAGQRRL